MFGHRNIQFGSIVYRYAILFAYFQQLTHIRVDYKKLSIRTVNITDDVRRSIARELHDGIGQHLAAAKLQTNLALHSEKMSQHLGHVISELENAVQGLRRLINGLHPVIIDQTDICNALAGECENIKKLYNVRVNLDAQNVTLDKQAEIHVFRIFQECTFNAIKHGKATEIDSHISTRKDHIHMIISDNGTGFMTQDVKGLREDGGFGFISLQERITLLNGRLDITSEKGKGCTVKINFPLKESSVN